MTGKKMTCAKKKFSLGNKKCAVTKFKTYNVIINCTEKSFKKFPYSKGIVGRISRNRNACVQWL